MLLLLAQATPSATELAAWISVLMYLGGFVATVLGGAVAVKSLRKPERQQVTMSTSPLEVKKHDGVATADDLRDVHGRIKREREEINKDIDELRSEMRTSADKLATTVNALRLEIKADNRGVHDRINEVLAAVSELKGRVRG